VERQRESGKMAAKKGNLYKDCVGGGGRSSGTGRSNCGALSKFPIEKTHLQKDNSSGLFHRKGGRKEVRKGK